MPYRLDVTLAGLPKGLNGSHGHWRTAAKKRKWWRLAVKMRTFMLRPKTPLLHARLIMTRYSSQKMDFDNLAGSFKSCVDGLKDAGVISDDKDSVILERQYLHEIVPMKEGHIRIIVEEIL